MWYFRVQYVSHTAMKRKSIRPGAAQRAPVLLKRGEGRTENTPQSRHPNGLMAQ